MTSRHCVRVLSTRAVFIPAFGRIQFTRAILTIARTELSRLTSAS